MKTTRTGLLLLGLLWLGSGTVYAEDALAPEAGMPRWVLGAGCVACPFFVGTTIAATFLVILLSRRRGARRAVRLLDPAPRRRGVESRESQVRRAARCPECGAALPADAPEGLCPQCLLKGVINSAHDAARSAPAQATAPYGGATAPSVEELAPLFPQLEILELIGQGGMGAVYKARQPSLDRLVAVKVLPPEAGRDPAFAERFNREARALARLSHPNIVAVHDVGQAGELYYFVMEYVDGVNLRQVLRDGQLTPEQALRIVPQICDALQYAHEEGIVHRDIKPENILLDRKGRVKIADFGLAKLLGRDTGNFTLTGSRQVMGTLYYMAPEQVERPLEVDHRADIYSLGVVFYEMLTGQLPVGRFPMPSEKAGTDAFLDEVVLRALEREPERRYQHASDVKTDVESPAQRATVLAPGMSADSREVARHQLRGPAISLMVMGVLGPLGWLVAFLIYTLFLYLDSRDRMGGNSWFWAGLDKGYGPFLVLFGVNVVIGGFLIAGARKLRRLEAYEFSVLTSLMAGLQIATPTFPVSFLIGGWAFWVLRKPEVKAAFAEELQRRARIAAATEEPLPQKRFLPAERVRGPALALLVTGLLTTVPATAAVLVFLLPFSEVEKLEKDILPLALVGIPAGALIMNGAMHLRRLRSRAWAMVAAILALLPCGLGWLFGLPVGLWALAVLAEPEVKTAFGERSHHT
jgi:tRNA A-37 threonylcarbamoyl transferase component Bud32